MSDNGNFDFWYAVNNTEVVFRPSQTLETFGATTLYFHLITEQMDAPAQVRVREGSIQAYRPEILTPQSLLETMLEGFDDAAARRYMDWLREHEESLMILKYGFKIRKALTNEHLITDSLPAVVERVKAEVAQRNQPLHAVLTGVDDLWEVCLLKLLVEVIQQSAPVQARDLRKDPRGHRHEIEQAFQSAARDSSLIPALAGKLREYDLFKEYEDRFFALVRSGRRGTL